MAAAGGRLLARSSAAGCRGFCTRSSANTDPPATFQPPTKPDPSAFQPPTKPHFVDKVKLELQRRFLSPEFIPRRQRTSPFKFYIERLDMIQRRKVIHIPEFYVGSILSVTTADPYAHGKTSRFVGICIQRGGNGLGGTFVLRNVIERQGIEICYELYNPRIQEIQVLKLEKRLDGNLMYLRDDLPQYSTFDVNMKPVHLPAYEDVPVNTQKVRMKPKPWSKRWERPKFNIQGIKFELSEEEMEEAKKWNKPWVPFDMMREYDTSKLEKEIWEEVHEGLKK
ncbi:39S ribosomal protein L19, mitochondrial [Alligator sinensis]|uniref:Large ribosomal subunit protein bL19m n=1 Tax=Alligator sinensis TaxID=38654 RepID=A0A1U7S8K1_ALLSI|nr:39S ribosomal protein L19, mitochondrial [Alligator sinensis]